MVAARRPTQRDSPSDRSPSGWTVTCGRSSPGGETIDVVPGHLETDQCVTLDLPAFADLFCERRTALGLVIAARVTGDAASNDAFCAWDPVFRSLLDGRPVYQPGAVTLRSTDGSPLHLDQRFELGEQNADAAHFLAETGFLLLQDVFTEAEMDGVDAELARAVGASPGRGWLVLVGDDTQRRALSLPDPRLRAQVTGTPCAHRR